ncbi:M23 family metallopeptidase [Brevibacillus ginsengisoli]|uniref:M23 family metallopeptidase n=1 Tax=Brevibacillus ginsengisoli TaxID=363854 RepID=UPI003CFAAF0F
MMTLLEILKQYRVTSDYGPRIDPITGKPGAIHSGVDLVGKEVNDPIESFTEGDVIYSNDTHPGTGLGNYGWVVLVKDRNGMVHLYAHLQKQSLKVNVGDHVVTGQHLGIMGSTGRSTGKHLHYEVRTTDHPSWGCGLHTNPLRYLEKLCKDSWTYYNGQGRQDKCNEVHQTAEYIRSMIA